MEKKKIVFLYTEPAGYFIACLNELVTRSNIEVHLVRWAVNKEAPFQFKFPDDVFLYNRNSYNSYQLAELIRTLSPDVICCSGWIDKDYTKICKLFRTEIPVIVIIDNQWKGTWKQRLAAFLSPFTVLNHYTHAFIPGSLQAEFAKRLGFKKNNILSGYYTADVDLFRKHYLKNKETKKNNFPKRFIYTGRYYEFKGIKDLWKAFTELQVEQPNDWELWCLGVGDIEPIVHPKIKHFGFVQPEEMEKHICQTGVFVLPSRFEPWGVVLHEFAAAGFPLVCSDETGARTAFVEDGKNGFVFNAGNVAELKLVLKKVMEMNAEELLKMGEISAEKALTITPQKWTDTILSVLK